MSKMERKKMLLLLSACVFLTIILVACGGVKEVIEQSNEGEVEGDSNISLTEPGAFPIVQGEPVELTVMVRGDARMEDIRTNAFTQYYEELTNVKINWEVAPQDGLEEALNLRLATGDLPDIFLGLPINQTQQMYYGQEGIFLDLKSFYEEVGYYSKLMFERNPHIYDFIQSPDGGMYTVPQVSESSLAPIQVAMWIYEPWLDQLGLDMPQNTDEFYEVLIAFRDEDPSGNGSVVPLAGSNERGLNAGLDLFLMNSFVFSPPNRLYLEDHEVKASFLQPGWKEGLEYLNLLYEERLIDEGSFTMDRQQLTQLGENPDYPILGVVAGGYQGMFTEIGAESNRWLEYVTIPPLEGPTGLRQAVYSPYEIVATDVITSAAGDNAGVAFRWLEGLYNPDVTMRARFGVPGEDWKDAEEGMVGLDGKPATIQPITQYGEVGNNHWYSIGPSWITTEMNDGRAVANRETDLSAILTDEFAKYDPFLVDLQMILPPLAFTEEQNMELADLETAINSYVDEMVAKFVLGHVDIEREWDNYLQTLEQMNIQRYIEIHQEVYDMVR